MAKLSANGRELARMSKARDLTLEQDDSCSWERKTYSFRSNGWILEKRDVLFRPGPYDRAPYRHSWGWTRYRRVKKGRDVVAVVASLVETLREKEWVLEDCAPDCRPLGWCPSIHGRKAPQPTR
jgi:hypothetical protein